MRGVSIAALAIVLAGVPLDRHANAAETPSTSAQPGSMDDISALLPLLMSSPERKQLALNLETSIRQGDLEEAERQLNGAIEMGTLAIVLVDRLRDPTFLPTLHALGIKGAEHSAASSRAGSQSAAVCTPSSTPAASNVSELQEALERERARGDATAWELATLTDEFRNLQSSRESDATSTTSKVVELQDQLQREREQGSAASRELAAAREELAKLKADLVAMQSRQTHEATSTAELADLKNALSQERERSTAAGREAMAAKEELHALQTTREREAASTASKVAELQGTLQQERERSVTAARDLNAAQQEIQALRTASQSDATSTSSKVAELQGALQQERVRSEAATRELAAARDELGAVQALLKRETAGAAELTEQRSVELKQLREALGQERARADAVSRELADAIDEVRSARNTHGGGSTPLLFRLDATGAPSPIAVRHLTGPLQVSADSLPISYSNQTPQVEDTGSTPVRISSLGDAPLPVREPSASSAASAPDQRASINPLPDASRTQGASAQATADDRLVARADTLLRAGDVSGARLLLERSMESGNARAAFLLAETFDPHFLSKLGALGIRSDVAKARELYARARALGITQADERMQALKQ